MRVFSPKKSAFSSPEKAGHAACDGMDGETNFRSVVFKDLREFFHDMLGLCDCHSVAGNEDDALGGFEDVEGVFGGSSFQGEPRGDIHSAREEWMSPKRVVATMGRERMDGIVSPKGGGHKRTVSPRDGATTACRETRQLR